MSQRSTAQRSRPQRTEKSEFSVPPFERLSLGPDSLIWRYSDKRLGLTGLSAGLLQLMHPAIGAGVASHSNFFEDPWDRIIRSLPYIYGVLFAEPGADAAKKGKIVVGFHRRINGTDYLGRSYDALDPETFWYAHATFQYASHQIASRFSHRQLTPAQREQLYREGVEWYARYGMPMDPVPPDLSAFRTTWAHYCTNVLEMTPAAQHALDLALTSRIHDVPGLPSWTNVLQDRLLTPIGRLTSIGGIPQVIRERFDIPWGLREQVEYEMLARMIKATWRLLPRRAKFDPMSNEAFDRALSTAA